MKKIIITTIAFVVGLLPLSAQISVKLEMNNTLFEVFHMSDNTGFYDPRNFDESKEELSVSVMYELPSENKLHLLVGGGLGYIIQGAIDATGAFGIDYQLFETANYNWSLHSTAKAGLILIPVYGGYGQISLDFIESNKSGKGFLWGAGLHSRTLYIPYINYAAEKDSKFFFDQGLRLFAGYKF